MTDRTPEPQTADLVKRLRSVAQTWDTDLTDCESSVAKDYREAADAIEELTAALRTIRNYCDAPHWSPKRKHDVRKTADNILSKYGAANG